MNSLPQTNEPGRGRAPLPAQPGSAASQAFLDEMRSARERLVETRLSDSALTYCIAGLARMEEVLARPLRVVILGEYNSGKTSVADLLIGDGLLPTSVVSNTQVPVLISYADAPSIYGVTPSGDRVRLDGSEDDPLTDLALRALHIALPLEKLRAYQILDTPSAAAPAAFAADADIILWCTVATRAWTESERATWTSLPPRCARNALLVATHKDGLQIEEEERRVTERLRSLTGPMFRDIVLVSGEAMTDDAYKRADDREWNGVDALRASVAKLATEIADRRARKAAKIVRRLARLTFHHLASAQLRPDIATVLSGWEMRSSELVEQLAHGLKSPQMVVEDLLRIYAEYAEQMRPGTIRSESSAAPSRALTTLMQWPRHNPAARRLANMLVADLTALLRMQSGSSTFTDPALLADYQTARSIVLALADLDGAFAALSRLLGTEQPSA